MSVQPEKKGPGLLGKAFDAVKGGIKAITQAVKKTASVLKEAAKKKAAISRQGHVEEANDSEHGDERLENNETEITALQASPTPAQSSTPQTVSPESEILKKLLELQAQTAAQQQQKEAAAAAAEKKKSLFKMLLNPFALCGFITGVTLASCYKLLRGALGIAPKAVAKIAQTASKPSEPAALNRPQPREYSENNPTATEKPTPSGAENPCMSGFMGAPSVAPSSLSKNSAPPPVSGGSRPHTPGERATISAKGVTIQAESVGRIIETSGPIVVFVPPR